MYYLACHQDLRRDPQFADIWLVCAGFFGVHVARQMVVVLVIIAIFRPRVCLVGCFGITSWFYKKGCDQISAKRGPVSIFLVEVNTEALGSKLNSRQSEYGMVRGESIGPQSKYQVNIK